MALARLLFFASIVSFALGDSSAFGTTYELHWHQEDFSLAELPCRFSIENKYGVENEEGDPGDVTIRTEVLVEQDVTDDEVQITLETEMTATVDDVPFIILLQIVNHTRGQIYYTLDNDLDSRTENRVSHSISRDVKKQKIRGATHINFIQYPADWFEPDVENAPGPIQLTTAKKHVILVPGILGDLSSSVIDLRDFLNKQRGVSAQIWDWTALWDTPPQIQPKLWITKETRKIGDRLARRLREWRKDNDTASEVYVLSMSAGTNIITMACEAKDDNGYIIPAQSGGKAFFNKIFYLSGALSIRHPLDDVARCSGGIYNYYSKKDDTLGRAYPRVWWITLNVTLAWPANGRFGYWQDLPAYKHIASQLAWLDPTQDNGCAERYDNNGRHLRDGCLAEEYFRIYFLPYISDSPLEYPPGCPDVWQRELHPSYEQEREFSPDE